MGPQVAYHDAPELIQTTPKHEQPGLNYLPANPLIQDAQNVQHERKTKILGLHRSTFWLLLALVVVIIIAGVGGGVGGAMAVQNARAKASSGTENQNPGPNTTPHPSSATGSATSSATSSATTSQGSIYKVQKPEDTPLVERACTTGDRITLDLSDVDTGRNTFACMENANQAGDDITGLVAYTVTQCLESCMIANVANKNSSYCVGVIFTENLAEAYKQRRADCYLKAKMDFLYSDTNSVALTVQ